MKNLISEVKPRSPAFRAGIRKGDRLLMVDGKKIQDVLDYMYYAYGDDSIFTVEHPDGTKEDFEIKKDFGQDAGRITPVPARITAYSASSISFPRVCATPCISRMTTSA